MKEDGELEEGDGLLLIRCLENADIIMPSLEESRLKAAVCGLDLDDALEFWFA